MSFSRMKPLPKFLIIGAIVGGVGFGVSTWLSSRPKAPEVVKEAPTQVPPEASAQGQAAVEQAKVAPTPTPQAPAPTAAAPAPAPAEGAPVGLTPARDAGLANVLGSKK